MRVSYSELTAFCKKVLEGCGLPLGFVEEGAQMAAWGEFSGLSGLARLQAEILSLEASDVSKIRVISEDSRFVCLDGGGQSSLLCGRLAADIVYAKAREEDTGVAQVVNCQGSDLLIQNAVQMGKRGMACSIEWSEPHRRNKAVMLPARQQPYLVRTSVKGLAEPGRADSFSIICYNLEKYPFHVELSEKGIKPENISIVRPETIQAEWEKAWQYGKEIDQGIWRDLERVSNRVLIAATERSRLQGAGENAN
ncbi:DUF3726 domain-containing protein [Brevibacillus sp. B_LB10_24]|uniref:DUF3726 domain-containing protein n=1 Tax=Brevibacillus sp. B_LB10_24 TaxID=3380645 RepID=UPI0038BAC142